MRTILGRVARDVERKIDQIANPCVQQLAESELELAKRVMTQERSSKNKVYSAHAPEVECISKGKVHKCYEFGVKVGDCGDQSKQLRVERSGVSGQSV